jgi:heat shock protein HslJ
MRRALPLLALVALLVAPASARAEDELPLPVAIECPAPVSVDGTVRIPDEAPADCVYPDAIPMPVAGDPCAPDEQGIVPEACRSGLPADGTEPCWITSDGATNCPDASPVPEASRTYEIVSVSVDGAPIAVAGRLTLFDEPGRLNASVGCNSIGGDARVDAGGAIELGELFMTEMYCADLAAAESALLAVLAGDDLRLDDDRLSSSAGSLELRASATTGDAIDADGGVPAGLIVLLGLASVGAIVVLRRERR